VTAEVISLLKEKSRKGTREKGKVSIKAVMLVCVYKKSWTNDRAGRYRENLYLSR
jgi:hypothetical protein